MLTPCVALNGALPAQQKGKWCFHRSDYVGGRHWGALGGAGPGLSWFAENQMKGEQVSRENGGLCLCLDPAVKATGAKGPAPGCPIS